MIDCITWRGGGVCTKQSLDECTFQPNLQTKGHKGPQRASTAGSGSDDSSVGDGEEEWATITPCVMLGVVSQCVVVCFVPPASGEAKGDDEHRPRQAAGSGRGARREPPGYRKTIQRMQAARKQRAEQRAAEERVAAGFVSRKALVRNELGNTKVRQPGLGLCLVCRSAVC